MGLLDKNYKITLNITTGQIESSEIVFATKDKNVANINVQFTKDDKPVDVTGFIMVANIQKPDTLMSTVNVSLTNARLGVGLLDIPSSLTSDIGEHNVEIVMSKDTEISYSNIFKYRVRETLVGEFEIQ